MAPQPGAPPVTNRCIPIEYPVNPDCMVDDHMVPFKERGLRGKAGSAPPLDLDKGSRGLVRIPGRMGSLIVGHSGPTVGKKKELSKKFWFQMVYCEFNSMDDLLARLQALQPTRAEDELAKLRRRAAEDDDIEVGTSTLSLKDPVSDRVSDFALTVPAIRYAHRQTRSLVKVHPSAVLRRALVARVEQEPPAVALPALQQGAQV